MKIKYIMILGVALATVLLAGCKNGQEGPVAFPEPFEKKTTPGIYHFAKAKYAFDKGNDQLYFNTTTNTFRIVSDDGSKYVEVIFDSPISAVGDKVKASIKSKGIDGVENIESVELEIRKKEGDNCWLWNQGRALGVLIFYVRK